MKVTLEAWAAKHFTPSPSLWSLRRMAREGRITPPPVKVGRHYMVEETARLADERPSLAQRVVQQGAGL